MTGRLFMLDTDTCIFLMRGESPALAAKVQSVPLQQQVMSAVTFAELTYGVQASAAAKHYAEIRADLKKRGAQLGAAGLMIAAHARVMGAIVVTNNVKDFERVKGLG